MTRSLMVIAGEIKQDWKNPKYSALPYLQAMFALDKVSDRYGYDSASSIVNYFLANAQSWRGETAKRIKKELKDMV